METYILVGVSFLAWVLTVVIVRLLMRESENAFLLGSMAGLLMAFGAGFAYYKHLAGPGI